MNMDVNLADLCAAIAGALPERCAPGFGLLPTRRRR
jgi:hypothetical protein